MSFVDQSQRQSIEESTKIVNENRGINISGEHESISIDEKDFVSHSQHLFIKQLQYRRLT